MCATTGTTGTGTPIVPVSFADYFLFRRLVRNVKVTVPLSIASLYNSGEIGTGAGVRRKTFNLVANLRSARMQDICSPFLEQPEAFSRCVDNDLASLKYKFAHADQEESASVEHIKHLSL